MPLKKNAGAPARSSARLVHAALLTLAILLVVGVFQFTSLFQPSFPSAGAAAPDAVTNVVPKPTSGSVTLTWTNPSSVDFTGTMVRYSATAFPASTTDGSLAGDVAGSPSAAGTLTVSGLADGTTYYFSLFSHNAVPEYGAAVNARQLVMGVAFADDFQALSAGNVSGQNGWAPIGGTWSVVDTAGEKTLQSSAAVLGYEVNRVLNGGSVNAYTDQMARVDWKGNNVNTPGQLFLRAQSASADAGGYFLWQTTGALRINYKTAVGAPQSQLATVPFTPLANTWYTYEFSVVNNDAGLPVLTGYVWQRGTAKPSSPSIQVTDTINRFPQGVFSVGKTGVSVSDYDNVAFYGRIGVSRANVAPGNLSNVLSWTNPTVAGYAGTVVRAGTSSYPASPTDGTLVADVAGASGGTSGTTHAGLTNGTTYYYTLFPYGTGPSYGTPLRLTQVAYPNLFDENFNALTVGSVAGQNGWSLVGGTWAVADASGQRVLSGTSTATTYPTNRALNGNAETTDQILYGRFQSDSASNTVGYVWLRHQANGSGYLVWHNVNAWSISYFTVSPNTLTTLATSAATAVPPMEASVWFNLEVSVINDVSEQPVIKVYLWRDGAERPVTPTLQATDSTDRFVHGTFGLGRNATAATALYDDVGFYGAAPPLTITIPSASVGGAPDVATRAIVDENGTFYIPYIQTSSTLNVSASAGYVPAGGGVEFVLDEGLATEQAVIDLSSAYTASFSGLAKGEYTLDAYVLDADGVTHVPDETFHDTRTDIGIGDIITVIGDSIVEGLRGTVDGGTVTSWLDADPGTVSLDNRNFPQYGLSSTTYNESFLTDLNDQLAAYYGYPVFLMNEGRGGSRADSYPTSVMSVAAWQSRQNALAANRWIVALGNNDGSTGHSASTYQADMTALLNTLVGTYGASYANTYVPYPLYDYRPCNPGCGTAVQYIATYLPIIDGLRTSLGLADGADLFNTFQNYQVTDYFDTVHPNAAGYVRMARLWALAFMKPAVDAPTVDGREVTLSWNDLSAYQPSIVGYRVRYGTDPDGLDRSLVVGDVQTATVSGLSWETAYYFDVAGFDDDPTDVSYTGASDAVTATTGEGGGGGGSNPSNPSTDSGAPRDLSIVRPAAGDRYAESSRVPLTWTFTGMIPFVDVYLSLDDGSTWNLVADDEVNDGFLGISLSGGASDATRLRLVGTDLVTELAEDVSGAFVVLSESAVPAEEPETPDTDTEADVAERLAGWPDAAKVGGLVKVRENSEVFYLGADGRRHSFSNEKVFFTWYCDFSSVREMSLADVARIPLGENVSYRPGARMVKLVASPRTYVVDRLSVLRWVTTEAVATVLYGKLWNTFIDDVAEALFGEYAVVDPVSDLAPYDPRAAAQSVTTPSDAMDIPGREPMPSAGLACP